MSGTAASMSAGRRIVIGPIAKTAERCGSETGIGMTIAKTMTAGGRAETEIAETDETVARNRRKPRPTVAPIGTRTGLPG